MATTRKVIKTFHAVHDGGQRLGRSLGTTRCTAPIVLQTLTHNRVRNLSWNRTQASWNLTSRIQNRKVFSMTAVVKNQFFTLLPRTGEERRCKKAKSGEAHAGMWIDRCCVHLDTTDTRSACWNLLPDLHGLPSRYGRPNSGSFLEPLIYWKQVS